MSSSKMIDFRVTGKVQGVFFRQSTISLAQSLKLRGWVRNDPDGAVVGQAAGPPEVLGRFEEFLRNGPEHARVDGVELKERGGKGEAELPREFQLRR